MIPSFLPIAIGVVFVYHGWQKRNYLTQPTTVPPGIPLWIGRVLFFAETLGGVALCINFLTWLAALGLSVIMMGAMYYKVRKWKLSFSGANGWELDFILLVALLSLL